MISLSASQNKMIKDNYDDVLQKVENAAKASGRNPSDVTLIAVSKTKPISDLMEAYEAGARDFGENHVQELMEKIPALPKDIRWHMIGHLQRNKVKYIVGKVFLIHSVDSLRLAEEINKESLKAGVVSNILLEVNVAGEESKWGGSLDETIDLVKEVSKLPGVCVKGLMTVAPYTDDPETNREYFRKLKELSVDIDAQNIDNISMGVLSMGMTGDYEVAVSEGATYVRVGTGIFGARNYNI